MRCSAKQKDENLQPMDEQVITFGGRTLTIHPACKARALLEAAVTTKSGGYSVATNAEKIIRCHEDQDFYDIVRNANARVCDGVAVNLFSNTGMAKVNWPNECLRICRENGYSLSTFGGTESVASEVFKRLQAGGIRIQKSSHGYIDDQELIQLIQQGSSDVIFLGLGSPRQEIVASRLKALGCKSFVVCCGGALDVISGKKRSAPKIISESGLEWLYRLFLEPRRWRRYLALSKVMAIRIGIL